MRKIILASIFLIGDAHAASASETISYAYDAQGRLVAVSHNGTVNNGQAATYAYDQADNRTNITVSGAAH